MEALEREASRRARGLRPYDVQPLGGMALHKGPAVEMKTGEGKTHSAALTEEGFETVHQGLEVESLTDLQHLELYHAVHPSVLAHGAYKRDVDDIVEEGAKGTQHRGMTTSQCDDV